MGDIDRVGGKNASLGEMISHLAATGVQVPGGFATTAAAYWEFLQLNQLIESSALMPSWPRLDVTDLSTL